MYASLISGPIKLNPAHTHTPRWAWGMQTAATMRGVAGHWDLEGQEKGAAGDQVSPRREFHLVSFQWPTEKGLDS